MVAMWHKIFSNEVLLIKIFGFETQLHWNIFLTSMMDIYSSFGLDKLTLLVERLEFSLITKSKSWLLMPWPCYWLYRFTSSKRKSYGYLHHHNIKKWYKYILRSAHKRLIKKTASLKYSTSVIWFIAPWYSILSAMQHKIPPPWINDKLSAFLTSRPIHHFIWLRILTSRYGMRNINHTFVMKIEHRKYIWKWYSYLKLTLWAPFTNMV